MEFRDLFVDTLKRYLIPMGVFRNRMEMWEDSDRLAKAFIYCLILRTNEGIDDFFEYSGDNTIFFKKKICEKLGLENDNSDECLTIIRDYLYEVIIRDGYVVHSTNSYYADLINQSGFVINDTDGKTTGVLKELKEIFPEGFFKTDLNFLNGQKGDRAGWYYDRTPLHFKRYCNGPEWFKRLTHGAYLSRDYVEARSFIEMIMSDYHEPYDKKIKAIEFLDKYWKIFAPTTPHLLFISTKSNDLRDEKEVGFVENLDLESQISYFTDTYFRINDQSSVIEIRPEDIYDIDFNKVKEDAYNVGGMKR